MTLVTARRLRWVVPRSGIGLKELSGAMPGRTNDACKVRRDGREIGEIRVGIQLVERGQLHGQKGLVGGRDQAVPATADTASAAMIGGKELGCQGCANLVPEQPTAILNVDTFAVRDGLLGGWEHEQGALIGSRSEDHGAYRSA